MSSNRLLHFGSCSPIPSRKRRVRCKDTVPGSAAFWLWLHLVNWQAYLDPQLGQQFFVKLGRVEGRPGWKLSLFPSRTFWPTRLCSFLLTFDTDTRHTLCLKGSACMFETQLPRRYLMAWSWLHPGRLLHPGARFSSSLLMATSSPSLFVWEAFFFPQIVNWSPPPDLGDKLLLTLFPSVEKKKWLFLQAVDSELQNTPKERCQPTCALLRTSNWPRGTWEPAGMYFRSSGKSKISSSGLFLEGLESSVTWHLYAR